MQVVVQVTNNTSIYSSSQGSVCSSRGALPTEAGLSPGSWTRAARTCTTVSTSLLLPAALSKKKWLCLFFVSVANDNYCIQRCTNGSCLFPGSDVTMSKYEWVPLWRPSLLPNKVQVPLFPARLTTPALPPPASHLDPSLFHLPRSSLCQIKKCLPCVLSPAQLSQKRTSCI